MKSAYFGVIIPTNNRYQEDGSALFLTKLRFNNRLLKTIKQKKRRYKNRQDIFVPNTHAAIWQVSLRRKKQRVDFF